MTRPISKTYVYIDIMNVTKNSGRVNYITLMKYLKTRYETETNKVEAKVFFPFFSDTRETKNDFTNFIASRGFIVIRAEANRRTDKFSYKDNTDIVMVAEIMDDLRDKNVTKFVLISGDKDFIFILQRIIHEGRELDVIGPRFATCYEYVSMKDFVYVESIPDILMPIKPPARAFVYAKGRIRANGYS
jgi:uncharacterized LabA/DUF88 family protein